MLDTTRGTLTEFTRHLTGSRGLAPRSAQAYAAHVKAFLRWARPDSLDAITKADVRLYLDHLGNDRALSADSLRLALASLRAWTNWLVESELIVHSPAASLRPPPRPRRLPAWLTPDETRALLAAPSSPSWLAVRDRAILTTLALAGLRAGELLALDIDHALLDQPLLIVRGKGQRDRNVPIHPHLLSALRAWLAVRRPAPTRALFTSRTGARLTDSGLAFVVTTHARAAGITRIKVHPHLLRHTFATSLHAAGVDLLEIQQLLGHASLVSTQIYTHTNPTRLQSAVASITIPE